MLFPLFLIGGVEHSDRRDLEGELATKLPHTSDTLVIIFFLWKPKEALVLAQKSLWLVFKALKETESFLFFLDWW